MLIKNSVHIKRYEVARTRCFSPSSLILPPIPVVVAITAIIAAIMYRSITITWLVISIVTREKEKRTLPLVLFA